MRCDEQADKNRDTLPIYNTKWGYVPIFICLVACLWVLCFFMPFACRAESVPDEELVLSVTAWGLPVASGTIKIWKDSTFEGKPAGRILAKGQTDGLFYLFHRVEDSMESYFDPVTFLTFFFRVHFEEGSYRRIQEFHFDQQGKKIVEANGAELPMLRATHDPLSAVMLLRGLEMAQGSVLQADVSDGKKIFSLTAKVTGVENKRALGTDFPCWIVEPSLSNVDLGGMLKDSKFTKCVAWITQTTSRVPILAKGDLFLGALLIKLKDRHLRS